MARLLFRGIGKGGQSAAESWENAAAAIGLVRSPEQRPTSSQVASHSVQFRGIGRGGPSPSETWEQAAIAIGLNPSPKLPVSAPQIPSQSVRRRQADLNGLSPSESWEQAAAAIGLIKRPAIAANDAHVKVPNTPRQDGLPVTSKPRTSSERADKIVKASRTPRPHSTTAPASATNEGQAAYSIGVEHSSRMPDDHGVKRDVLAVSVGSTRLQCELHQSALVGPWIVMRSTCQKLPFSRHQMCEAILAAVRRGLPTLFSRLKPFNLTNGTR